MATTVTEPKKAAADQVGPVNPYADPVAYLREAGWKCLGNPEWASALWLDPTQPLKASYSREPVMYRITVKKPFRDPTTGENKVGFQEEERQVLSQDGNGGTNQLAFRDVFHPKVTPVLLGQALMTQIERDAAVTTGQMAAAEEKGRKAS